jgi:hypothetical protein
MSPTNLSRRAILAGAASVPALALPATVAIAAPTAAPPAEPDPIFVAIERARRAEAAIDALDESVSADATIAPADECWAACSALARTVPTTPAGLAALTSFLREAEASLCGAGPYFDRAHDAQAFAISLDTAVRGMTGLKPLATPANARPDPILAVIEAHRRAWDDLGECSELDQAASAGDKKAARKLNRLGKAVDDATAKLVDLPPTTIAGASALLAYAADFASNDNGEGWPDGEAWISRRKYPWEVILYRNLAKTLQTLAVQS